MPATAEILQATDTKAIRAMVLPLGIKLPTRLPDYAEKTEDEIYTAFGSAVDRLLGTSEGQEYAEGVVEADGLTLSVSSRLKEEVEDAEAGAWCNSETSLGMRWLSFTAPLEIKGPGLGIELQQKITLEAGKRAWDDSEVDTRSRIMTGLVIPTTPVLEAFRLGADRTDETSGRSKLTSTNWQHRVNELEWYSESGGMEPFSHAFGIGTEVLKRVEPDMLTLVKQ
jgi:hypothetical protein